jgi:phage terminase large subunit-like protein
LRFDCVVAFAVVLPTSLRPSNHEIAPATRSGRLRHDGNPVLEWCLGNVVGKADRRGNLYPTKQRPEQKIDAAVALMMAMGRAMVEDEDAKGLEGFLTNPIFG